jgi:hypothetical protein
MVFCEFQASCGGPCSPPALGQAYPWLSGERRWVAGPHATGLSSSPTALQLGRPSSRGSPGALKCPVPPRAAHRAPRRATPGGSRSSALRSPVWLWSTGGERRPGGTGVGPWPHQRRREPALAPAPRPRRAWEGGGVPRPPRSTAPLGWARHAPVHQHSASDREGGAHHGALRQILGPGEPRRAPIATYLKLS